MDETGGIVHSNIDHNHDGNPIQIGVPPYPVLADGSPNPIYQNLVHTHYETPIDQSNQHHERSVSEQLDQNSMNSYGFNHVYANPTFSGYPEIPAPDYPVDDSHHSRRHSSGSSDSSFSSKVVDQSSPTTRRASSSAVEEAPPQLHLPEYGFHNIPLDRPEDTITVIEVPDDHSYWTVGIYSTIAFVSVIIVILIIWSLVYYGI